MNSNQKKLSHAVCSHAQLTENGDNGLNLGCHQCEKLMLFPPVLNLLNQGQATGAYP